MIGCAEDKAGLWGPDGEVFSTEMALNAGRLGLASPGLRTPINSIMDYVVLHFMQTGQIFLWQHRQDSARKCRRGGKQKRQEMRNAKMPTEENDTFFGKGFLERTN